MHNLTHKEITIWGYGVTGRAAARLCYIEGARKITTIDSQNHVPREPWEQNLTYVHEEQAEPALAHADTIFLSPGIDVNRVPPQHRSKMTSELDFFAARTAQPIIGITGTVGKTTIATLLSDILIQYGMKVKTGGNIGVPCFDLLREKNNPDLFVLELSSFQLDHARAFAPDLAIITNISPNHLDRHKTLEAYQYAKLKMLDSQKSDQHAILPLALASHTRHYQRGSFSFVHDTPPSTQQLNLLRDSEELWYLNGTKIIRMRNNTNTPILDTATLPAHTFSTNWLIICAALATRNLPLTDLPYHTRNLKPLSHRLEPIVALPNLQVYNDSKATTPAATLAAVHHLAQHNQKIALIVGGLSKGVNRQALFSQLPRGAITGLWCFGHEAAALHKAATTTGLPMFQHTTLEATVQHCLTHLHGATCVLLSPSGSSFDLFDNYQDRGEQFRTLVQKYLHSTTDKLLHTQEIGH